MEQQRTRQPPRRKRPQISLPARRRRVPPPLLRLRGLPNPRFTGLGAGLFATATMLFLAFLDRLLLDGAPVLYGALFLPVSAMTALWVRPADLVTAPIGVPIAFAVGAVPIVHGTGGFGGLVMGLVSTLAVHAGWLYGGTLVAGVIASVRKVRQMGRRQLAREVAATRAGTGGGTTGTRPGGRRTPVPRTGATASRAVRRDRNPAGAGGSAVRRTG